MGLEKNVTVEKLSQFRFGVLLNTQSIVNWSFSAKITDDIILECHWIFLSNNGLLDSDMFKVKNEDITLLDLMFSM